LIKRLGWAAAKGHGKRLNARESGHDIQPTTPAGPKIKQPTVSTLSSFRKGHSSLFIWFPGASKIIFERTNL
jgi:hypothetical protein